MFNKNQVIIESRECGTTGDTLHHVTILEKGRKVIHTSYKKYTDAMELVAQLTKK